METVEISRHQLAVFDSMKGGEWRTAAEVAASTKIAGRTARHHLSKLAAIGVLEEARVFPGHRYRMHEKPSARAVSFIKRMDAAAKVFS